MNRLGIYNRSADCYMNSIIQCLMSSKDFVLYFTENYKKMNDNTLTLIIYNIIKELMTDSAHTEESANILDYAYNNGSHDNTVVDCMDLKHYFKKLDRKFSVGIQNDSQEFLLYLINELHYKLLKKYDYVIKPGDNDEMKYINIEKEYLKNKNQLNTENLIKFKQLHFVDYSFYEFKKYKKYLYEKNYSPMSNIFGSSICSELKCLVCNNVSVTYYQEFSLLLEINKNFTTLYDCLDSYTYKELLDGENSYKCEICNKPNAHNKRLTIFKQSNNLIIVLKKFNKHNMKTNGKIDYPFVLDMKKYTNNTLIQKNTTYNLFAINYHSGGTNGGHYYSDCKNFSDNQWYSCNDENVSINTELNNIEKTYDIINSSAYILFYKKNEYTI